MRGTINPFNRNFVRLSWLFSHAKKWFSFLKMPEFWRCEISFKKPALFWCKFVQNTQNMAFLWKKVFRCPWAFFGLRFFREPSLALNQTCWMSWRDAWRFLNPVLIWSVCFRMAKLRLASADNVFLLAFPLSATSSDNFPGWLIWEATYCLALTLACNSKLQKSFISANVAVLAPFQRWFSSYQKKTSTLVRKNNGDIDLSVCCS